MKKVFKIVSLSMAFWAGVNPDAEAQWAKLSSGSASNLYGVHFPTSAIGYAVGNNGTILKTLDTGNTWFGLAGGCSDCLYSDVRFVNKDTGYVVGETNPGTNPNGNGVILKTTNGGISWTNVLYSGGTPVRDLFLLNRDTLFACGGAESTDGKIWKSVDAGNTWLPASTTYYDALLGGLGFIDSKTGFMGVYESVFGTVNPTTTTWLNTKDGTSTFGTDNVASSSGYWVFATDFTSSKIGYMSRGTYVGTDSVYIRKTTDGGVSWKESAMPLFTGSLYGMEFIDADTGYMVGSEGFPSRRAVIRKTIDGGKTWFEMTSPVTNELRAVNFVHASLGFAVGLDGTIIRYKVVGQSSSIVALPDNRERIRLFPNPAKNELEIIGIDAGAPDIYIADLSGSNVLSLNNYKSRTIDVGHLCAGLYIASIHFNGEKYTLKFIKE